MQKESPNLPQVKTIKPRPDICFLSRSISNQEINLWNTPTCSCSLTFFICGNPRRLCSRCEDILSVSHVLYSRTDLAHITARLLVQPRSHWKCSPRICITHSFSVYISRSYPILNITVHEIVLFPCL